MSSILLTTEDSRPMRVPVILKGTNYYLWSRTIKIALCGKSLENHVLEEKKPSEDSKEKEDDEAFKEKEAKWFREDQQVLGIIHNSIEPTILEAYSYCDTAKELWDTLKNVYGDISNLSRVFELKKELYDLQQEDMEFKKHFGKFQTLWNEVDTLRPTTTDPKVLKERKEQDKVFGLLLTLSPIYNGLIKHILRDDKLPGIEEVCSKIQKEQGNIGLFKKDELISANNGIYKQEKKGSICDHCKRTGHTKDKCWKIHSNLRQSWYVSRDGKANTAYKEVHEPEQGSSSALVVANMDPTGEYVKKSDLEALIKAMTAKNSGITFFSQIPLNKKPNCDLIVDSGASHHMISNPKFLDKIEPAIGRVEIANGDGIPIEGKGNLRLFDKKSEAFYVPKFKSNLISVGKATKDLNCLAIFSPNDVYFQDIKNGRVLGKGEAKEELYVLENISQNKDDFTSTSCFSSSLNSMWHARLGHPHTRALEIILPNASFDHESCEACILGKHCRIVFPKSSTLYENCFDLVHSDVWTSPCMSRDGNKYFVTFIDQKSKYTWVTLLSSKDRVFEAFTNFQNYVTNQFNAKIKVFRSDNGGEYTSQRFKEHLAKHGIIHQTSCPYTPQQNGVAERKNRHLMEVARSMMFHTNVPKKFWGDAVLTACYLINRTPTKVLEDLSAFEVLNKTKPFIEHLRVFGCVCFAFLGNHGNKLEARSIKCMFLGYSSTQKGYKCYDPTNNRIYVSREVKFLEGQGYYDKKDWESLKDLSRSPSDLATSLKFLLDHLGNDETSRQGNIDGNTSNPIQEERREADPQIHVQTHVEQPFQEERREADPQIHVQTHVEQPFQDEDSSNHEEPVDFQEEEIPQPRRSERLKEVEKVNYNNQAVAHPNQATCSLALLPSDHQAFIGKIEKDFVPTSYEEAKDLKEWVEAVSEERGAMERTHTWDVEEIPQGKKTVSSKWVFTIKYNSSGAIERYKARLVARGFTQTYGEDYTDTFAPVAKLHTVRVVLSLATNLSWDLWQMDVKNAFLQGELEEEVYMTPPPGLEDLCKPGQALRLRKAIYGLKQSPRAWYHKLSTTLMDYGFQKSHSDHTLFTIRGPQGIVVVLVYVDDLIITGDDKEGVKTTKAFLTSIFDIKDLGEMKYFLGLEVCRSPDGLFLSQRKYTIDLLKETGKLGSKPAKTPLEDGYKVNRKGEKNDERFKDVGQYRRLVGKLIYLTLTRPDLCFAVNQVSQHMQEPTVYHWSLVDRILRYINGSSSQGIWMGKNDNTEIVGYCDADWAGDRIDRRSTTGYCTFIGGNLVTWKTKKQKVVSCSSAEAEYRAMRALTNELTWLKALLKDFGIEKEEPITIHCDNQAAIHIATNAVFHERTKHIEIDCHKVREKIEEGVIQPCYTRSEDQLADIFTKAASLKVCNKIYSKLGLVDLSSS